MNKVKMVAQGGAFRGLGAGIHILLAAGLVSLALNIFPVASFAVNGTWLPTAGTAGDWNDTTFWTGGTVASGAGATATFDKNFTGNQSPTGTYTIGYIYFRDPTSVFRGLRLTDGTITFDVSTGMATITVDSAVTEVNGGPLQLGGGGPLVVQGSDGLVINNVAAGAAAVRFRSAVDWSGLSGGLWLNAGLFWTDSANLLPQHTPIGLGAGVQVQALLNASRNQRIRGLMGGDATSYFGANDNGTGGGTLTLGYNSTGSDHYSFAGILGGDGFTNGAPNNAFGIAKTGACEQVLSGNNLYTEGTDHYEGTLAVGHDNALGTGPLVLQGGTLVASNGSRSISNPIKLLASSTIGGTVALTLGGAVTNQGGNRTLTVNNTAATTISGPVYLSNASDVTRTLTIDGTGNLSISGVIADLNGAGAVTGKLTKAGSGTLTLSANNTYVGTTDIQAGTLALGADNVLADVVPVTVTGGTLSMGAYNDTVASVQLTSGAISGSGGTLTSAAAFDLQSGSVSAKLGGSAGAVKSTAGTVTLSGNSTFTGVLNVQAGTLAYGANNALADAATISVPGGTLNIGAFNDTVAGVQLTLDGVISGSSGVLTSTTDFDLQKGTVSAILGGSVAVAKTTSGSVTLSGNNTYSGGTTINAGLLAVGHDNALGSGPVTIASSVASLVATNAARTIPNSIKLGSAINTVDGSLAINFSGIISNVNDRTFLINNSATTTLSGPVYLSGSAGTGRTLTFDGTGNVVISGAIANFNGGAGTAGNIVKTSTGTMTLSGVNTYSGFTAVSNGSLLVTGSADSSAVTVSGGGTLAGTGSIGSLGFTPGGVVSPGTVSGAAATLSVVGAVQLGGGVYTCDITGIGGTQCDKISAGGAVSSSSASTINLPVSAPSGFSEGGSYSWTVMSGSSASAANMSIGTKWSAAGTFGVSASGNDVLVTYVPPAPSVPAGVTASDGDSTASTTVSWTDGAGEDGYVVWRNTDNTFGTATAIFTNAANVATYADSSGSRGQLYYYWVTAFNSGGNSAESASDPGYRRLFSITINSASDGSSLTGVDINWVDNGGNSEIGFGIWRHTSTSSGSSTYIGSTAANTTDYTDNTAVPGQLYYYWVRATNSTSSSLSNFGTPETGYRQLSAVNVSAASDGTSGSGVIVSWVDGAGETSYSLWRNTIDDSGSATYVGSSAANATSYTDSSAIGLQTYYYWVRATNSTSASQSAFGTSDSGYRKLPVVAGVSATTYLSDRVTVSWTDSESGETGYTVWRGTSNSSNTAALISGAALGGDATSYDDMTAAPGATYYYWVRSTNNLAEVMSDFGNSVTGYVDIGTNFWWDADQGGAGFGGSGTWDTLSTLWRVPDSNSALRTWLNAPRFSAFFTGDGGVVSVAEAIELNQMTFMTSGYTLTNGSLTLAGSSPSSIVASNGVASLVIASALAGTNSLWVSTPNGVMTLGGTNNFTGSLDISNGTVRIASSSAFGGVTAPTFIRNGAAVDLNGQTTAESFTYVEGNGPDGNGAIFNNSGAAAQISQIISNGLRVFSVGGSGDMTFAGVKGSAGLTMNKIGTGTLTLNGTANNVNLDVNVSNGVVQISTTSGRAAYNLTVAGGSARYASGGSNNRQLNDLTVKSGTFDLNGADETTAQVMNLYGTGGTIQNSSASPVKFSVGVNGGGQGSDFGGVIADGVGGVALTKNGSGTQTLSGANTFLGETIVSADGTLRLAGGGSLASTQITLRVNSTLDVDARTDGTLTVAGYQTISGIGTIKGDVDSSGLLSLSTTAPGILRVTGDYSSAGAIRVPLAATAQGLLVVQGTATLGGDLTVTSSGYAPATGQSVTLLVANAISGTFATTNLPVISGVSWSLVYDSTTVVLLADCAGVTYAPYFVSLASRTGTNGQTLAFQVVATNRSCTAPVSITATGLPSGASFNTTGGGMLSLTGIFSWAASGPAGSYPVRFIASNGVGYETSRTVMIYINNGSEVNTGSGVPVSQTNWHVAITNMLVPSSGNATVVWAAAAGVTYDVYSSLNGFGAGSMTWTKEHAAVEAGSSVVTAEVFSSTQRYYQVVLAGQSPSSSGNGMWATFKPNIGPGFTLLAAPVAGIDLTFDGEFGATLAAVLTGSNSGVGDGVGDEVFVMNPGGTYSNLYLDGSGVWRTSGGGVSTMELSPGQGFMVLHNSGTTVKPVFNGPVGNVQTATNTLNTGYNIIGLSEGEYLNVEATFDDYISGLPPTASYDETSADMIVMLDPDGSYRRLQRLPNGTWYDLKSGATASMKLMPGQAYYYYRVPASGAMGVRF